MFTYSEDIISDLHKDARGFRPTEAFWNAWNFQDDEGKQTVWNILIDELEETMAEDRRREAEALENFRAQIKSMKKLGAETTRQAIKWIFHAEGMDRYDLQYGADYVAYHFGMSYQNPYRAVIQECCDQASAVVQQEEAA
jgi:hypothetical protein